MSDNHLPIVNAVWIGKSLGQVHAACLRSFQRHGHEVVLHAFDPPEDTPAGIKIFDASKLMRRDEVLTHRKTGSLSLASDIYRYRMLREGMGLYVDCDIYCLKPFPNKEYLFGWESDRAISNAVLHAPYDSELVTRLNLFAGDKSFIPPWRSKGTQRWMRIRNAMGLPISPENWPWGTLGPRLLTHLVEELGMEEQASPIDAFYALHYDQTPLLFEPGLRLEDIGTPRSYALHLANSMRQSKSAPEGSPLHTILSL